MLVVGPPPLGQGLSLIPWGAAQAGHPGKTVWRGGLRIHWGGSCRIIPSVTSNPSGSLAILLVILMLPDDLWYHVLVSAEQSFPIAARRASIFASHGQDSRRRQWDYPVVIINWVQYLGPPVPFSFPDSRDLLEVLGDFLGRERGGGP